MKAFSILFVVGLALTSHAQTNTNFLEQLRAERARLLNRAITNNPSATATGAQAQTIPLPGAQAAPVAATNRVLTLPAPPAVVINQPAANNVVVASNSPPATAEPGVAGQVPTRAPLVFPAFPEAPTLPSRATVQTNIALTVAADTNVVDEPRDIGAGEIDLKNAPLEQVFDLYQQYANRTVLRPVALPVQGITLNSATPMSRREAIQALDSVLALNGVVMIPLGELFVKAVPAAQAPLEGGDLDTTKPSDLPESEQFITRVVTLKTAKPSEVQPILQTFAKTQGAAVTPIDSNNTLVLRDYASSIKRMLELIEKIDVLPEKDFKLEVIPIKYGKVGEIYATMSALISGSGGGAAAGSGFSATGVGGRQPGMGMSAGSMMRNRGMGGMGSQYGGLNSMNRGYGNQYGNPYGGTVYPQQVAQPSVAGAQNSFQNRLNNIINRATQPEAQQVLENANIVPDERSNKLLIFANKRDMEMITNIVAKVDVLLAQVLIEAVILEVSLGDTLNYGVSASQNPKQFTRNFAGAGAMKNSAPLFSSLTNFPGAAPSGFSYFGTLGSSFDVAIQALASDRKANVISRPRIQTSHAIPGNIFVGETRPYITGFNDYNFGSSFSTRSQVQEKIIGLTLDVTPYITPEGFVVMELMQQFDSFKGNLEVEGNPYPLVDSRSANSMLTVRNGDLIMLGGFITDSRSKTKTGVPILKDIPGLGALFRSTAQESTRTELIILMKATVLETPEQAAFLAAQERATLPGIREADLTQADADAERQRKVNRKARKGF